MMSKTKYCKGCDRTLPLESFCHDKKGKHGRAFYCRECTAIQGKNFRHSPKGMYASLRSGDRYYKDVPVEFSKSEFLEWHSQQNNSCAYCNIPQDKLKFIGSYYYDKCDRLTIDRKNNNLCYQIDNIALSCYRCNMTKGDVFTYDEMVEIGRKYLEPKWRANKEKEEQ